MSIKIEVTPDQFRELMAEQTMLVEGSLDDVEIECGGVRQTRTINLVDITKRDGKRYLLVAVKARERVKA